MTALADCDLPYERVEWLRASAPAWAETKELFFRDLDQAVDEISQAVRRILAEGPRPLSVLLTALAEGADGHSAKDIETTVELMKRAAAIRQVGAVVFDCSKALGLRVVGQSRVVIPVTRTNLLAVMGRLFQESGAPVSRDTIAKSFDTCRVGMSLSEGLRQAIEEGWLEKVRIKDRVVYRLRRRS
jgi:hypothetical protein